ncbi:MAG: hypothetical protein K2P73_02390 [Lachnospiraceae bacterium]|nr:hypothetical protein [Lachnospiraceae bacterium]
MININNKKVDIDHFPDGTLLLKDYLSEGYLSESFLSKHFISKGFSADNSIEKNSNEKDPEIVIKWNYENNEELLAVLTGLSADRDQGAPGGNESSDARADV